MGSGRDITCPLDAFSATLAGMLKDVDDGVARGLAPAVRKGARAARRKVKANARGIGLHEGKTFDRYVSGWSYRVRGRGKRVEAEVGNAKVPGLPHLIEKGHAKVGGGSVPGREHIAPAAEEAFDIAYAEVLRAVEAAL